MFPADTYIERRKQLKKQIGSGVILFMGNHESPMNYMDNTFTFRQDSSFLYYFGLNLPSIAAVIDVDEDKEFIFGDEPSMHDIIFLGPQKALSETAGQVGVSHTGSLDDMETLLAKVTGSNRKVHYLPQYRGTHRHKVQEERVSQRKSMFLSRIITTHLSTFTR